MDWGLAKVLPRAAWPTRSGRPGRADAETVDRARVRTRLRRRRVAGRQRCWARRPTWPPSRPAARSTGSTSGPTSSAWARSSARSSPAQPPFTGRDRRRDPAQGGAGRPGRRPGPARRLRGRRRAGRPGRGLPGRRAGGPAARRRRGGRADRRPTSPGVQERLRAAESPSRRAGAAEEAAGGVEERTAPAAPGRPGGLGAGADDRRRPERFTYLLQQRQARRRGGRPGRWARPTTLLRPGPARAPTTRPAGRRPWPPPSGPTRPARRRPRGPAPARRPARARSEAGARRRRARPGPARPARRHPRRPAGRRPRRLGHRRRLRRRLPRRRPRPRRPGPGGGRGQDPAPARAGGPGAGRRPGRLGGRAPARREGRGRGWRRLLGGGPRRRPRPVARPSSARPWTGRGPQARLERAAGPGRHGPTSTTCRPGQPGPAGHGPGRRRATPRRPWPCSAGAAARHPGDVWVNYDLARLLEQLRPPRREEAIRYYTAARALRPETAHELAHALEDTGRGATRPIAVFRDLIRLAARTTAGTWLCLGRALQDRGRAEEAGAVARRGRRRRPRGDPAEARRRRAHINLGNALTAQGKLDEAIAEFREAIRLKPDYAEAHNNLGIALRTRGSSTRRSPNTARRSGSSPTSPRPTSTSASPWRPGEARRGDRRVPRGDPAQARPRRGPLQPRRRPGGPGEARRGGRRVPRGDPAQARLRRGPLQPRHRPASPGEARRGRSPRTARRSGSSPTSPRPTSTSAIALRRQGKLDEADRRLPRGDPAQARPRRGPQQPRHRPGGQGKLDEAIAEYREAIRLKPDYAEAHDNLGIALEARAKLDEAIAAYREAIRLKPDYAEAHCNLGILLVRGSSPRRVHALERATALLAQGATRDCADPCMASYPTAAGALAEHADALAALAAARAGRARTGRRTLDDWLARCATTRVVTPPPPRLSGRGVGGRPEAGRRPQAEHRYNAACAAALAGCRQGEGRPARRTDGRRPSSRPGPRLAEGRAGRLGEDPGSGRAGPRGGRADARALAGRPRPGRRPRPRGPGDSSPRPSGTAGGPSGPRWTACSRRPGRYPEVSRPPTRRSPTATIAPAALPDPTTLRGPDPR